MKKSSPTISKKPSRNHPSKSEDFLKISKNKKVAKKSLLRFCIRVRGKRGSGEVQIAKVQLFALFALWRSRIARVALLHTCTTFLLDPGARNAVFQKTERIFRKVGPPGAGPLTGGDPPGAGRGGAGGFLPSLSPLGLSSL